MRKLIASCVLMLAPLHAGAGQAAAPERSVPDKPAAERAAAERPTPDQQARALFDSDWEWRLQNQPEYATSLGDYRYDTLLSDTTLAASRAANAHQRKMLEQAGQIERDRLSPQQQLSYDLFVWEKQQAVKAAALYPFQAQPISAYAGIHVTLAQVAAQMPFATENDYRNYLARLDAVPAHVSGLIEQLREGMRSGWVAPKAAVRGVPPMLRQLRENAVDGALGLPFRQIPATIDKPVRDALALAGPVMLRNRVAPALQELEDFLRNEYVPGARDSIAASALPSGLDYYLLAVARQTTVDMAPAAIHALGLKEVARLRGEMTAAIARTGFSGSFAQFIAFAKTDPRLFYTSGDALLARYRRIIARAGAAVPKLFAAVPAQEVLVKAATGPGTEKQGAAWYEAGSADRPAAFVVNTSLMETRPMWEMETLALHEALPGHHLQVVRAAGIADLPAFRRHGWHAAYGEGWALYAETLGPELGFYKDAFSAFGHLNAEMFRAVRLVVDTGIHTQGWTRQQALDYMNANTANAPGDNELEVDRYIAWPGQALGYKVGQLKIRALRDKAQAALGEKFDIRRFHSVVLDNGPLTLALLEQQVDAWIAAARKPAS
ncbi:DUF885 domain-containing protein [Massilia atriviolacea]|uniref:DUF885 domain-containing protein n=1 Tax=Massilia atriviolacea TaxID=2495579 RepID=A0A430HNY7_9BURK|nr:DUF885 domain-containing protein [Massilia atriviolacea]RSZ59256.1 DUF885 domain-containing protein [Massilia atriviolacea]